MNNRKGELSAKARLVCILVCVAVTLIAPMSAQTGAWTSPVPIAGRNLPISVFVRVKILSTEWGRGYCGTRNASQRSGFGVKADSLLPNEVSRAQVRRAFGTVCFAAHYRFQHSSALSVINPARRRIRRISQNKLQRRACSQTGQSRIEGGDVCSSG